MDLSTDSCWTRYGKLLTGHHSPFLAPQAIGEFILTDPEMKIKPRGKIYSINEGYESQWDESVKKYVNLKKYPQVS